MPTTDPPIHAAAAAPFPARLHARLLHATRGWRLVTAWSVFGLVLAWMQVPAGQWGSIAQVKAHAGGHGILNTLPGYGAELAYAHLKAYSDTAWRHYGLILLADVALLIPSYVLGLSGLIARLTRQRGVGWQALAMLPIVAGACNLLEDLLIAGLHGALPQEFPGLAALAGGLTGTKALLLHASLLVIAVGSTGALLRHRRRRRPGRAGPARGRDAPRPAPGQADDPGRP